MDVLLHHRNAVYLDSFIHTQKSNGQRSIASFTLMTGIKKLYRYTYHIAPAITYNTHNMIRIPAIEGPSKIIRYT